MRSSRISSSVKRRSQWALIWLQARPWELGFRGRWRPCGDETTFDPAPGAEVAKRLRALGVKAPSSRVQAWLHHRAEVRDAQVLLSRNGAAQVTSSGGRSGRVIEADPEYLISRGGGKRLPTARFCPPPLQRARLLHLHGRSIKKDLARVGALARRLPRPTCRTLFGGKGSPDDVVARRLPSLPSLRQRKAGVA